MEKIASLSILAFAFLVQSLFQDLHSNSTFIHLTRELLHWDSLQSALRLQRFFLHFYIFFAFSQLKLFIVEGFCEVWLLFFCFFADLQFFHEGFIWAKVKIVLAAGVGAVLPNSIILLYIFFLD